MCLQPYHGYTNRKAGREIDCIVVKKDTFIELRFARQNLEQIFEMQKDPLVSQKDTPQTKASIRIVLGTLDELYRDNEKLL